jgi:hypothetical protein
MEINMEKNCICLLNIYLFKTKIRLKPCQINKDITENYLNVILTLKE